MKPTKDPCLSQRPLTGRLLGSVLSFLLIAIVAPGDHYSSVANAAPAPATDNPIVLENQQPGDSGWMWTKLGDDTNQQIKGYASSTSLNQNESLTLYVSVNPAQTYTIDFYRIGWYAGLGGRLRLHVGPVDGVQQPACPTDPTTGLIACNWTPSYTLTVPTDWTSGVYLALLTNAQGFQNYVVFVVRDGRPAPFLYQQSVVTDEAYNDYPNDGQTGKSLYGFNSYGANTVSGDKSAVKVSFDRPMADSGLGNIHRWEMNFIRWLERSGYDTTYSSDIDTHINGPELLNHKGFFSVGHDEYWSKEMRDAVEAARDAGVNLGFFGANGSYTQVRFESSSAGVPNRVVVEYRNYPWSATDPVQGPTTTTNFRYVPVNRPEQTLIGIQYNLTSPNIDYVVTNSSHWVYAGTGFKDGDHVSGIVGYEADSFMPSYPPPNSANQTILSASPFTDPTGVTTYANSSIYQAPSGAWVFGAGTISWSWGLDDSPGVLRQFKVDPRIQQTTANILNAFLTGVAPTITSFTPTIGPVGTSVTINGTNFTGAAGVTFNGSAASFTVTSATAIQATVPAGATTGPISVTTSGGTVTSASNFMVAPTITSFTPTSGRVGASVTISGANFSGATAVTFNGTAASFTVTSATAIQATVPTGATTGPISVTTPGGKASSATNFTVRVPLTVTKTSLLIGGTVTSSPTGINCGSTCSADFNSGSVVKLTATPGFLSTFTGWNGCDTANGTTCIVTMNAAKTVTANFLP